MDHQQKAPECAYKYVFFTVLRTCMQNRKQADIVRKKGACTVKQALSPRNKGESRLGFDQWQNHRSVFFFFSALVLNFLSWPSTNIT